MLFYYSKIVFFQAVIIHFVSYFKVIYNSKNKG